MIVDLDIRFLLWREWLIACEVALYQILLLGKKGRDIFFDEDNSYLNLTTLKQKAEHVVVDACVYAVMVKHLTI